MKDCEEDMFCGVNVASTNNPDEMDALEKKHTPVITAPDKVKKNETFEVKVEVGKYKDHPNEHGHFIQEIELYSGDTFLGRAVLTSAKADPVVTFNVSLEHEHPLVAVEHCNLHGTWSSFPKKIEVE